MARINTTELVHLVSETAYRVDQVCQDPTVITASKRFTKGARATATSAGQLVTSVAGAWVRASAGRPPLVPRANLNLPPAATA